MNRPFFPFLLMTVLFVLMLTSCKQDITGKWTVTDMKVDMKDVPQLLIDRAKMLSLATSYEFCANDRHIMTILENDVENIGRKHKGGMTINSKQLILDTDSLFVEDEGRWKLVERNEFNAPFFKSVEMKIEKVTSNQIILSEKENGGIIYYTLTSVDK